MQVTPARTARTVRAVTADGVQLHGVHRADAENHEVTALIQVHGFTHHTGYRATSAVSVALAAHADVVAFDLRGHGRSGGRNTVGDRELLDLDAAVAWARAAGYGRVATVGFSLGAAVALRHAAAGSNPPDAVTAVSSPARWYARESAPMRRLHWVLEQPHGRMVAGLLGVRLDQPWVQVPPSPVEAVADIAPIPLLIVHFAADPYFPVAHADALVAASGGHAQRWTEPGRGHGETGTGAALAGRLARWSLAAAGPGVGAVDGRSTVGASAMASGRAASAEDR